MYVAVTNSISAGVSCNRCVKKKKNYQKKRLKIYHRRDYRNIPFRLLHQFNFNMKKYNVGRGWEIFATYVVDMQASFYNE